MGGDRRRASRPLPRPSARELPEKFLGCRCWGIDGQRHLSREREASAAQFRSRVVVNKLRGGSAIEVAQESPIMAQLHTIPISDTVDSARYGFGSLGANPARLAPEV